MWLKLKKIFKERWKYYLVGYIFGYLVSFLITGVPNPIYLIPIKLFAVAMALLIGTAFYYGVHRVRIFESQFRILKYILILIMLTIIFKCLYDFLLPFGIDITPFLGTEIKSN